MQLYVFHIGGFDSVYTVMDAEIAASMKTYLVENNLCCPRRVLARALQKKKG